MQINVQFDSDEFSEVESGLAALDTELTLLTASADAAALKAGAVDPCAILRQVRDILDTASSGFWCKIPGVSKLCDILKKAVQALDIVIGLLCS